MRIFKRGTNSDSSAAEGIRNNHRRGIWRTLDLIDADGGTFLRRRGLSFRGGNLLGINIHHIDAPDPGLDLHDHPWAFFSIILRGGYMEEAAKTTVFDAAYKHGMGVHPTVRRWKRWSFHRMPLHIAHRIIHAEPGTITLMVHGRKLRKPWGFYTPTGWVAGTDYDYETRRPSSVRSSNPEENTP